MFINILIVYVIFFVPFFRVLLTAFQAFCECVGDLEMGKVNKCGDCRISRVLKLCHQVLKWIKGSDFDLYM